MLQSLRARKIESNGFGGLGGTQILQQEMKYNDV